MKGIYQPAHRGGFCFYWVHLISLVPLNKSSAMISKHIHKLPIRHAILSIWFLFVIANSANAADMAGRYLVSGVGKDSCRSFVDADVVGKSYYRTWLSGYITSHNYN